MKTRKKSLNSTKASSKSPPTIKEIAHASASTDSASELNYPKTSEDDEDVVGVGVGSGSHLNFRSLQLDHRSNSKGQLSPTNSNNAVESTKKCMNCNNSNGGTSSPSSASTTSTGKVSHADIQGETEL